MLLQHQIRNILNTVLFARLKSYGFSYNEVESILRLLNDRKYRTKKFILFLGVTQGSVFEPLLLSMYLCELFLFVSEYNAANYAVDTMIF